MLQISLLPSARCQIHLLLLIPDLARGPPLGGLPLAAVTGGQEDEEGYCLPLRIWQRDWRVRATPVQKMRSEISFFGVVVGVSFGLVAFAHCVELFLLQRAVETSSLREIASMMQVTCYQQGCDILILCYAWAT